MIFDAGAGDGAPAVIVAVGLRAVTWRGVEIKVWPNARPKRPALFRHQRMQPELGRQAVAMVEIRMAFVDILGADRGVIAETLGVADLDRERILVVFAHAHGAGEDRCILGKGRCGQRCG
jgi:hypothetical protein